MPNNFYKKYQKLLFKQKKIDEEIEQLQKECPHESISIKPESDTGNWSRSEDSYSVDVKCDDCGMYKFYDSEVHQEQYNYWMGKR